MLLRILSILFPLFAITALGFVVGRRRRPDLSHVNKLNMDVFGAVLRPVAGMVIAWALLQLVDLPAREQALLLVFGALPPAVLNYMFAERYGQEPDKVASMVLIGNMAALVFMPLALAVALRP